MERSTVKPMEDVIEDWLVARVSEWLSIDPRQIAVEEPFANYGMTSIAGVSLAGDLEEWLGIEVSPVLTYEYPTIRALARHLVEAVETARSAGSASSDGAAR